MKSAKKFCLCLCMFYLSTGTHFEDDRRKDSFSKLFFLFSTFCFYFNNCGAKIGSSFKIIIIGFQTVKKNRLTNQQNLSPVLVPIQNTV